MSDRLVLVTGGNRGIGFEICRQLANQDVEVILTSRDADDGRRAVSRLERDGLMAHYHQLDVTDEKSIEVAATRVEEQFGKLDVLINNAGIYPDRRQSSLLGLDLDDMRRAMEINAYGPLRTAQAFVALLEHGHYPRIVNVSTGMAQFANLTSSSPAYRLSKVMLNMLTRLLTTELEPKGISVYAACPGWVRTDMGTQAAPRSVEEGADTMVWLATTSENIPSGGLWRDRQRVDW